jgi:hypothetical protein
LFMPFLELRGAALAVGEPTLRRSC